MSAMMDTAPITSAFRFTALVRRIFATLTRQPARIELGAVDPHTAAASKALVRCGGYNVEFQYLVMTGLAAYGDRKDLEARARGAIRAAINAAGNAPA